MKLKPTHTQCPYHSIIMALFIILTLFSLLSLKTESLKCPPLTFPHSEFQHSKFLCKQNQTTIQFPSYGELIVKSISYNPKKLNLVDPNNCVHRVFFNLNLTLTPFHYYYALKDFTYLNCSSTLISSSYEPVPCLSGPGFSVYVVDPGLEVPVFCKALKTVGIPFGYSDYLDDDTFGLGLTWDLDCGHGCFSKFGAPTCFNAAHNTVLWISILIFMVAMVMISAKTYCSKKMDMMNETKKNQIEVDKLLGDFEAL